MTVPRRLRICALGLRDRGLSGGFSSYICGMLVVLRCAMCARRSVDGPIRLY